MTIAVTGATGGLGRLVLRSLKEKMPEGSIRALARSEVAASELGVPVRLADYAEPATLGPALEGVQTLILISSNEIGQRVRQHHNVIAAAKAAGVSRIVYTSVLAADRSALGLAGEHRETEAELKASGLPFTLLRNGWYFENYIGRVHGAVAAGALIGAAGDGRISAAARADYAEAAAVVATSEGHLGRTYELAGDESFTLVDLAAEISRQTGRTIAYRDLSESEFVELLLGSGLPKAVAPLVAGFDAATAKGALLDEGRHLSKLIGRPTISLADAVADLLGEAKASGAHS